MIEDIQILRAISVLFIISGHNYIFFVSQKWGGIWNQYFSTWVGVDIFFAVSGFVITTSFLKHINQDERHALKKDLFLEIILFWIRRIFRIWPAAIFWAVAVVACQLIFDVNPDPNFTKELVSSSWAAILQINNFHQANFITTHGHWTHGGIFWSLSTEEQFYIVFPIAACLLPRKYFIIALLLLTTVQMPLERSNTVNTFWYFFRTDAISLGVLVAILKIYIVEKHSDILELFNWMFSTRAVRIIVVPFILISILILPSGFIQIPQYTSVIAILSAILVFIASFDKKILCSIPAIRSIFLWLGSRSFSIYLCQIPYLAFMFWTIRGENNFIDKSIPLKILICFGVFGVAELSYRFIERKFQLAGTKIVAQWTKINTDNLVTAPSLPSTDSHNS